VHCTTKQSTRLRNKASQQKSTVRQRAEVGVGAGVGGIGGGKPRGFARLGVGTRYEAGVW
jgi:hypothetical protein